MRWRDFIAGLMLPISTASAQHLPVVAFITAVHSPAAARYFDAIRRGLLQTGFEAGRDVEVEHHTFERRFGRLPELVVDLERSPIRLDHRRRIPQW